MEIQRSSSTPNRLPMARPGTGTAGKTIQLLTNHFKVSINPRSITDAYFYQYNVCLAYEDGHPADAKDIGRKAMNKVHETYRTELAGMHFAYDGEKSLYTIGALPSKKLKFMVVLEDSSSNRGSTSSNINSSDYESDRKRLRRPYRSKAFNVEISFAAKFPMNSILSPSHGRSSEQFQDAVRVLDIILREHAAKRGCLVVRQSFFDNNPRNFIPLGSGVLGCRGFNSSFRTTQGGLFLNMDVSNTLIIQPGPVLEFLLSNQNVRNIHGIDWNKARRMLKNLRIKTSHTNAEWKITGLSERPCGEQKFLMKQRNEGPDGGEDVQTIEVTVYDYFVQHRNIRLDHSANLPCINVGKSKRPVYIPLELCSLVSLQRYTKALSPQQRSSLVEKSRQKPQQRMESLQKAIISNKYDANPMFCSSGISISTQLTQVEGRVLPAPRLKSGNEQELYPQNGRWNFNNKKLAQPTTIGPWLVTRFSTDCDMRRLILDLIKCAKMKGISMENPTSIFTENPQYMRESAPIRVDKMLSMMRSQCRQPPKFILCVLPQRKNCDIYGPWKQRCLSDFGVPTQCISPSGKVNDQYLTNLLLKINAKLGGLNSLLNMGYCSSLGLVSSKPTLILGMDVSHGSPGQADMPSIAAVVSSRKWPSISNYRAAVRTQSPKLEMIDSLFQPQPNSEDTGIIRSALMDFYQTSGSRKPELIIIFRDGVGDSQFNQVLNIELEQIIQACKLRDEQWHPKFMVIVAQKNHHTRFFQNGSSSSLSNVPPGTIVDSRICHTRNNDFYLCAHAGIIGTSRPTHYHVLLDDVGFPPDDLQQLVHSLCYIYQRSTTAVSVVAPICYAHLAAAQVAQFIKFGDFSGSSSAHAAAAAAAPIPHLPSFHHNVADTMFFC